MKNTRMKMRVTGLCALLTAVMVSGTAIAAPLTIDSSLSGSAAALLSGAEEEASDIEAAVNSALEEDTEVSILLDTTAEETAETTEEALEETSEETSEEMSDASGSDEEATEETVSAYASTAICQADDYVNIRTEASADSEALGKIYTDAAATVLETVEAEDGTWYHISSGSVDGYVKAEYFAVGEAAEAIASEAGTTVATVNTTTLRLRSEASTESSTLALLAIEEEYEVVEDCGEFVKISVEEDLTGYVLTEYVDVEIVFEEAISLEEEQAAAEEAAAETSSSSDSSSSSSSSSSSTSSLRSSIVSYAVSFVGKVPYVYGGSSLSSGVDCSGFVQAVYAHFGISLPRTSSAQGSSGTSVSSSSIQPGDLVYYGGHIAIYIGNGQIVHASTEKTGVKISNWNYKTPLSIRNVIG